MSMTDDDDHQLRIRGAFADIQFLASHIPNAQVWVAGVFSALQRDAYAADSTTNLSFDALPGQHASESCMAYRQEVCKYCFKHCLRGCGDDSGRYS